MNSSASFHIRRASAADAVTLSVVGQATFLEAFSEDITGPDLITHCRTQHSDEAYANALTVEDNAAWLAETTQTAAPIGYALVTRPDIPDVATHNDDLELKRIYALWRYHGAGVGPALMRAALDHARAAGAKRLILGVYDGNARAMAFYARHGFDVIGRRQFAVGDQIYNDAVMGAAL